MTNTTVTEARLREMLEGLEGDLVGNYTEPQRIDTMRQIITLALEALALRTPYEGVAGGLPPRDAARPTEEQGLFRKFDVRRVDGSDAPGGKHHGCRYFVLDVDHDPHANAALTAYAAACEATHPQLAADLRDYWNVPALASPSPQKPVAEAVAYLHKPTGNVFSAKDHGILLPKWQRQFAPDMTAEEIAADFVPLFTSPQPEGLGVEVTDEMVFRAMAKADELGEVLDDIDAREILTAALQPKE